MAIKVKLPIGVDTARLAARLPSLSKDPQLLVRLVLGVLLLANLVAAWMVFFPPGGSPEDLAQRLISLRAELVQRQTTLRRTKAIVINVEKGRGEGDQFLGEYFLGQRTASSTIISELVEAAGKSGVKPREHAYSREPIEGSDDLSMMTITANYEGSYQNFVKFINLIDKSPRLLIIDTLQAAPQAGAGLHVSMKLDAFVKSEASGEFGTK